MEADILQPAETLLDLYGEDIRARAYVTADPLRGEMMLRPDFTVPVVQAHMAHGAEPARYCYMGEVFRQQYHLGPRQSEYVQVGYEVFDGSDPLAADAEVFALFARMLQGRGFRAATGDFGILIAAVRGHALGGGCELALHADLILAGRSARFGQPEVKVGIMPGGGATQRLTRALGKHGAMKLLLLGDPISGPEAVEWGIANSITFNCVRRTITGGSK